MLKNVGYAIVRNLDYILSTLIIVVFLVDWPNIYQGKCVPSGIGYIFLLGFPTMFFVSLVLVFLLRSKEGPKAMSRFYLYSFGLIFILNVFAGFLKPWVCR